MKVKNIILYTTGIVVAAVGGFVLARLTKKTLKKSGTINIILNDNPDFTTLSGVDLFLGVNSNDAILQMCKNKCALFDITIHKFTTKKQPKKKLDA